MHRVLVIGSGGAGKSTFAKDLAMRTGLPLVHLDALYWRAGWVETPKTEWTDVVERLLAQERWVMDGNYGGTLDRRLAACDTVVFLDLPRWVCLWRVIRRWIQYRGQTRPDMAAGCEERLTWEFVMWIWRYPADRRSPILKRLSLLGTGQRVIVLRSGSEARRFLEALSADAGPNTILKRRPYMVAWNR
ncbi:MAG: DNA topology modulation protein [Blastocatellia bacterium]